MVFTKTKKSSRIEAETESESSDSNNYVKIQQKSKTKSKNISIEKIFTANYPIKYSVMCKRITSYNFCAVFFKNSPYARKSNTYSE